MVWNPFNARRRVNVPVFEMQDINEPRRRAQALAEGVGKVTDIAAEILKRRDAEEYRKAKIDSAVVLSGIEAQIRSDMMNAVQSGDEQAVRDAFEKYADMRAEALQDKSSIYSAAFDEEQAGVYARLNAKRIEAVKDARAVHSDLAVSDFLESEKAGVGSGDGLYERVARYAEKVDASYLPFAEKQRRRYEGASELISLGAKRAPSKTAADLANGKYDAYIPRENAMKIAKAADDEVFYKELENDPERLIRLMDERKDIFVSFSAKDRIDYRKKAENQLLARKKFEVAQDNANRAYAELDFFRAPTAAKLDAFDFRGNEKQREKWLLALESVPNQLASTRIESVSEIASALESLATMPADTPENREKLFKAAADRMADLRLLNQRGELNEDDMNEYQTALHTTVTDMTLRRHLQDIAPVLAGFRDLTREWIETKKNRRDERTFVQRMTENPIKKYGRRENGATEGSPRRLWNMTGGAVGRVAERLYDSGKTADKVDVILSQTVGSVLKMAYAGDAAGAEAAYRDGVSRARVTLYPETAGKKKGDLIRKDGIVYTYEGDDGLHPIYKWGK